MRSQLTKRSVSTLALLNCLQRRRTSVLSIIVLVSLLAATRPLKAADVFWSVDADGQWTTNTNWSSGVIPQSPDNVIIDRQGTYTITIASGTHSIASLNSTSNLILSGGSLNLESESLASNISGALELKTVSSSLGGVGSITLTGPVNWNAGSMTGSGKTRLSQSSVMNIAGAVTLARPL
jgi:hypothetical protein